MQYYQNVLSIRLLLDIDIVMRRRSICRRRTKELVVILIGSGKSDMVASTPKVHLGNISACRQDRNNNFVNKLFRCFRDPSIQWDWSECCMTKPEWENSRLRPPTINLLISRLHGNKINGNSTVIQGVPMFSGSSHPIEVVTTMYD